MSSAPNLESHSGTDAGSAGQQQWLEAVLDLLPLPSLLVEPGTGRILFTNRAAHDVPTSLSTAGNELNGQQPMTDDAGGSLAAEQLPWHRAARGEVLTGQEVGWLTPQGRVSFLVFSGTLPPMYGHSALTVLTFLDVTHLKATEAELRQAVQTRDEFFSVATHELKDPLFSLQLSIQLLRRTAQKQGCLSATILQHLEVSQRQSDRLARLIDNLLDVSRITNHRIQLDLDAFELSALVREVAAGFQEQARSAATPLTVEPGEPIIGYWDRGKVEQIVSNLLSNALKYGAGQPVKVRLWASEAMACVQVEDRGVGIAPEDQGRIFDRFERASGDHRQRSLGLGLYIVRSLVEAHGGSISVTSQVGQGASFTVQLPRKRLPPAAVEGDEVGEHQEG